MATPVNYERKKYFVNRQQHTIRLEGTAFADSEQRYTPDGKPVCSFRVNFSRRFRQGNEWKEQAAQMRFSLWPAQQAVDEGYAFKCKAGDYVGIEVNPADFEIHTWDQTVDGQTVKRSIIEANARSAWVIATAADVAPSNGNGHTEPVTDQDEEIRF